MATTPGELAVSLATGVVNLYNEAEALVMASMSEHIAKGIDAPDWQQKQLSEIKKFQSHATTIMHQVEVAGGSGVHTAMVAAAEKGTASAVTEMGNTLINGTPDSLLRPPRQAIAALSSEIHSRIVSTHFGILSQTESVYRGVIERALIAPVLGVETRQQAAQRALNEFASRGITGFKDSKGRNWQLSSYVEMAMRTGTMNAQLQGHAAAMESQGKDLLIVSDHTQECKLCRPFEGKILSLNGKSPNHQTLATAKAAGLFHPGCRHSFSVYFPGMEKSFGATADPAGDQARQRLRALERRVRLARREEALALDPAAKKKAAARARAYQKQIKDHVAATGTKRQPHRERITGEFGNGDKTKSGLPKDVAKLVDNPYGKKQLTGSFAPKNSLPEPHKYTEPVAPPKVTKIDVEFVNPLTGNAINNPATIKNLQKWLDADKGTPDEFFADKAAKQKAKGTKSKPMPGVDKKPDLTTPEPPKAVEPDPLPKVKEPPTPPHSPAATMSPAEKKAAMAHHFKTGEKWETLNQSAKDVKIQQMINKGFEAPKGWEPKTIVPKAAPKAPAPVVKSPGQVYYDENVKALLGKEGDELDAKQKALMEKEGVPTPTKVPEPPKVKPPTKKQLAAAEKKEAEFKLGKAFWEAGNPNSGPGAFESLSPTVQKWWAKQAVKNPEGAQQKLEFIALNTKHADVILPNDQIKPLSELDSIPSFQEYYTDLYGDLKPQKYQQAIDEWVADGKPAGGPHKYFLMKHKILGVEPPQGRNGLSQFAVPDPDAPLGTSKNPRNFKLASKGKEWAQYINPNKIGDWPANSGIQAIRKYTGSSYTKINEEMRAYRAAELAGGPLPKLSKTVTDMDKAMASTDANLKEWMITSRGVRTVHELGFHDIGGKPNVAQLKALVGKESEAHPGYASTSVKNKPAFGGTYQMIIRCPPGTRGIYVDGAPGQYDPITSNQGEDEFLLARETKYKVVSVEPGTNGFKHNIILEIVSQHGKVF